MKKVIIIIALTFYVADSYAMSQRKRARSLPELEIVEESSVSEYDTEPDSPSSPESSPKVQKTSPEGAVDMILNSSDSVVLINYIKDNRLQLNVLAPIGSQLTDGTVMHEYIVLKKNPLLVSALGQVYYITYDVNDNTFNLQKMRDRNPSHNVFLKKFPNPKKGGVLVDILGNRDEGPINLKNITHRMPK